jgi:hypothetical protein
MTVHYQQARPEEWEIDVMSARPLARRAGQPSWAQLLAGLRLRMVEGGFVDAFPW